VFVDTSAFYVLFDRDDARFSDAQQIWQRLLVNDYQLVTTNYVLLETIALLQRRIGIDAVRDFENRFVPLIKIHWVDSTLHSEGAAALLLANRRQLSLVDCVSFIVCNQWHIDQVFAFDAHFEELGLRLFSAESDN
jgi:predicted nucleic acid-binding protein